MKVNNTVLIFIASSVVINSQVHFHQRHHFFEIHVELIAKFYVDENAVSSGKDVSVADYGTSTVMFGLAI